MPHSFSFEHPTTEEQVAITPISYLWAGLFGAIYVLVVAGARSALRALFVTALFAVAIFTVVFAIPYIPGSLHIAVLVSLVPITIYLHGVAMIRIVHRSFRRRGWRR